MPSGLAALLAGRLDVSGKNVVIVLSGGNVDFDVLAGYSIDDLVKARPQINFLLGIDELQPRRVAAAPAA